MSKPIAPMSTPQRDGSAFGSLGSKVNVQLARPSSSRCRRATGSVRSMRGITTRCTNRANGEMRNSTRLRLTICGCFDQSGLPRLRSSATTWGQGTQARQPPSSTSRFQTTDRLPLIAKERCNSSDTLALRSGLIRFQSKNRMITTSEAISSTRLVKVQVSILRVRVIAQDS
ncbi:hypothetical protein D3C78_1358290 [compost metagenome]